MSSLSARLIHTHDTEENWNRCVSFVPKKGEIIVYDPDDNHRYPRFKMGNGLTAVTHLPFAIKVDIEEIFNGLNNDLIYLDAGRITAYNEEN